MHYRPILKNKIKENNTSGVFVSPMVILIFGAVCISFSPIFVKSLGISGMGLTAIGFWRALIGGLALIILNFIAGKSLRINRTMLSYAALAGFVFAADLFFWHRSVLYVGAGISTILGNTQVFFTALLAIFIFREKLSLRYTLSALSAFVGLVLLINILNSNTLANSQYILGVVLGIATGISYALFLTTLKIASNKHTGLSSRVFMVWISLFTALFMGVTALIENHTMRPANLESILVLLMLGIIVQALGWWVIAYAITKIKSSMAALVLLLQPTLATFWGVLFFDEVLELIQYIGAAIMLTAIYFGSTKNR